MGAENEEKPWYKKIIMVSGILIGAFALIQPLTSLIGHPLQVHLWIYELLIGLAIYGVSTKIES